MDDVQNPVIPNSLRVLVFARTIELEQNSLWRKSKHIISYMKVSGQLHTQAVLRRGNRPCFHWIRGSMGLRAGLDAMK
jgi:hypothetical protein